MNISDNQLVFSETAQMSIYLMTAGPMEYLDVLLMIRLLCFCLYFLTDINECETQQANCAHGCHNTLGSFSCVCLTAYELGSDGKQCYSESTTLHTTTTHY